MGLDGTIMRLDGAPLGDIDSVRAALAAVFPEIAFGIEPSGIEKIRIAAERGIVFPSILRVHLESRPESYAAAYEGDGFTIGFALGSSDVITQVDIVIRGKTVASKQKLSELHERYGWITSHPCVGRSR